MGEPRVPVPWERNTVTTREAPSTSAAFGSRAEVGWGGRLQVEMVSEGRPRGRAAPRGRESWGAKRARAREAQPPELVGVTQPGPVPDSGHQRARGLVK